MVEPGLTRNNMPEFPEVYTVIEYLKGDLTNRKILYAKVLREKNIQNGISFFLSSVKNSKVIGFDQIGKHIVFILDNDYVITIHLAMEGKFFFRKTNEPFNKHDIVIFYLDDNRYLAYNDTRKFGHLKILNKANYRNEEPLNRVGPNPFEMKDASRLVNSFKNKKIPIKTALLDQSVMSGLGNIYVDEVLFDCMIHPETPANLVNKKELENVLKASKDTLARAMELGGSTIHSYHPSEGIDGEFQINLKVYDKKDGKCVRCGHHLRKIFVNARGTTYCPHCQKNKAAPYVLGVTGPIASGKSTVSKYFENRGFKRLSADEIVRELYNQKEVINFIDKLGDGLVKTGVIDRNALREFLLDNPIKKKRLEKHIHSLVTDYIKHEIDTSKQSNNLVVEVPLLYESHLDDFMDEVIYVDISKETQKDRLSKRGDDVTRMLELNKSFNAKENKKKATFVVDNNHDEASLHKNLDIIFDKVKHH